MTLSQVGLWLIGTLLIVLLSSLQFVEPIPQNGFAEAGLTDHIQNTLYTYRLWAVIILSLGSAVLSGWGNLYRPKQELAKIRLTVLETIHDELFNGDRRNIRITIFKDMSLFRKIRFNIQWIVSGFKGPRVKIFFQSYIFAWGRLKSHWVGTFLEYDKNDENKCIGLASVARHQEGTTHVFNLPDISDIDLTSINLISI